MEYVFYSNELAHHGILGQKHGIRRFQYSDGSLTPAGRLRYGVGGERGKAAPKAKAASSRDQERAAARAKRIEAQQAKKAARVESRKVNKELSQKKDQEQQELRRYEELRRTPAKRLSENEIKELTARLQMEKSYKDLLKQTEDPKLFDGKKFVVDILQSSGKTIITGLITYGVGTAINNAANAKVINVGGKWEVPKPPEKKKEQG